MWVDGGWGVDALLGKQTRTHGDLDLAVDRVHLSRAQKVLVGLGFHCDPNIRPGMPARAVMIDAGGRQVDLHPLLFDANGNGWQRLSEIDDSWGLYPAEDLKSRGVIAGVEISCLSPRLQVRFHQGYEQSERDKHDLELLEDLMRTS